MNLGGTIGGIVRDAVRDEIDPPRTGFWHDVGRETIEWVRVVVERYDPVRYEEWATMEDERTCPICGQLDGTVWEDGYGFNPPVHDFCRCERRYHHTEFRTRYIEEWHQRTVRTSDWQWKWNPW